jgi:hypothetical protein
MSFEPYKTILVKPAAALVPFSPYALSNTTVGDVPTATICGVNSTPHIFVGKGPTAQSGAGVNYEPGSFYNATPGKKPEDVFAVGDTFAIVLQGYPIARLRASGALTEGAEVTLDANGQVGTPAATDRKIIGVTLGAAAGANSEVDVLIQVVANPLFVPV